MTQRDQPDHSGHRLSVSSTTTSDLGGLPPSSHASSEERYRLLVAALADVIWATDAHGVVVADLPSWRAFTGQAPDALLGWGWMDAIHPEDREVILQAWLAAVRARTPFRGVCRLRGADGTYRDFSLRGMPVGVPDGTPREWVGAGRDITDQRQPQRRTHRALAALLAMAETLVATEGEATATGDAPTTAATSHRIAELICDVLDCTRTSILAIEPHTGTLRPMAVVGLNAELERALWDRWSAPRSIAEVVPPEVATRLEAGEVLRFDSDDQWMGDRPNRYQSASLLVAPMLIGEQLVGLLALDHGEEPHRYTTDELALAQAVARLAAFVLERERLLAERETARASALALREANRRMDEFLSIVSHELRNPLAGIKANVQLGQRRLRRLAGEAADATLADALTEIAATLERGARQATLMNRLVGDLLDVSRISAGRLELRQALCDLCAVVREAVTEQRMAQPERQITLALPAGVPVPVVADADRVGQVVTNFLSNALKYAPAAKPITVRLEARGDRARVSVRDEGPGLPLEEQAHIWDRFHQARGVTEQAPTAAGGGLGLGLHISRTLIERQGGQVGLESAPDHGATFWFELPLVRSVDGEASAGAPDAR